MTLPFSSMSRSSRRRSLAVVLALSVILAISVGLIASRRTSAHQTHPRLPKTNGPMLNFIGPTRVPTNATTVTIGGPIRTQPVPAGFLGLSLEYTAIKGYAGQNANAINPVFVQLIRNLAPGQRPVIRIGGDTTDWTWWPVPHMAKPPGIRLSLNQRWLHVI